MKLIAFFLILLFSIRLSSEGQVLTVFDADQTNFPVMRAHFFAFDSLNFQINNLLPEDFIIFENGKSCNVLSVNCPASPPPEALSSVLTIDVSGSMSGQNLNMAKSAARVWINLLILGFSECAITSFDNYSYLNQDFTTNRTLLLNAVNQLTTGGGTNYDAAFFTSPISAIPVAQRGIHKRVIVFLSDGSPNFPPNETEIIRLAVENNITIHAITLFMPCPQCLINICEQTNGTWHGNVSTEEQARAIYTEILQASQNVDPCTIEWLSDNNCTLQRNVSFSIPKYNLTSSLSYSIPVSRTPIVEILPKKIDFNGVAPGTYKDEFITVTAKRGDIIVDSLAFSNPHFSVSSYGGSDPPFPLPYNQSRTITVRYTPEDSFYIVGSARIISSACNMDTVFFIAGFPGMKTNLNTLKIVTPNGGEQFIIGTDTLVEWMGILPEDTVRLEYSTDAGSSWNILTRNATGLRYVWKNIPNTPSNTCLMRASTGYEENSCTCQNPGVEACFPFNGNGSDQSGNFNDSELFNIDLTSNRYGQVNRACSFNGTDSYISIPPIPEILHDFSVSFWVKTNSIENQDWPNAVFLIDRDTCGNSADWSIGFGNGGKIQFNTNLQGNQTLVSINVVNDDVWHHIVVMREGINKRIYIDGVANASSVTGTDDFTNTANEIRVGISLCKQYQHNFYSGKMDDMVFYSRAISAAEVQCLFNSHNIK